MENGNMGALIRSFRKSLHMTQEELAHNLGITVSTVNRWENGHALPSRMARNGLASLADERGVSLGEPERRPASADGLTGRPLAAALR
jgi:transcriptional regulator with XRE-family HTH domain